MRSGFTNGVILALFSLFVGGCGSSMLWGPRITNGIEGSEFRDFTISGGNPNALRLTTTGEHVAKAGFNQTVAIDPGYIYGGITQFTIRHSIVSVQTGDIVGYGEYEIRIRKYRNRISYASGIYGSPENDISFLTTVDGVSNSRNYGSSGYGKLIPVKPLHAWRGIFREKDVNPPAMDIPRNSPRSRPRYEFVPEKGMVVERRS